MDVIRIHHADSETEAAERHRQIIARLEQLGKTQVELMMRSGGLPTNWNPIILAWLSDK